MRLFVACELAAGVVAALARVTKELRARIEASAPRARLTWVPAERLHLTVRFIGEVDEGRARDVAGALAPALALPPFEITVGEIGAFPPKGPPRVIWAGIAAGRERMADLERAVSARLEACGVPPEARAYSPHLTLARVREAGGLRARAVSETAPAGPFGTSVVDAITLFQSRMSPDGPTYVPLQHTALRG